MIAQQVTLNGTIPVYMVGKTRIDQGVPIYGLIEEKRKMEQGESSWKTHWFQKCCK